MYFCNRKLTCKIDNEKIYFFAMDTFESVLSSYNLYHRVDINTEIENAFKI